MIYHRAFSSRCKNAGSGLFHALRLLLLLLTLVHLAKGQGQRSYKGTCKDKCDASQGGGPEKFKLVCDIVYETPEERQRCRDVCTKECGENDCEQSNPNYIAILCRGDQIALGNLEVGFGVGKDLENQKQEKEAKKADLEKRIARQTRYNNELLTYITILLSLVGILILAIIGYFCLSKIKLKQLQQQQVVLPTTTNPSMGAGQGLGGNPGQQNMPVGTVGVQASMPLAIGSGA